MGYEYDRTAASHDIWTKKNFRSIPVWGKVKEIPALHLQTSCRTIGTTLALLYKWAENNC
jgi:hypothetical protein